MYSTAPRLSAVTAVRTEPCPVMSTALVSGHASWSSLMSEMPLRPGSCRSDNTRWKVSVAELLERRLRRQRDRGLVALEVQQLLERLGEPLVVIDDQDLRGHLSRLRGRRLSRGYASCASDRLPGLKARRCTRFTPEAGRERSDPRVHQMHIRDGVDSRASERSGTCAAVVRIAMNRAHVGGWSPGSAERVPQPHRSIQSADARRGAAPGAALAAISRSRRRATGW